MSRERNSEGSAASRGRISPRGHPHKKIEVSDQAREESPNLSSQGSWEGRASKGAIPYWRGEGESHYVCMILYVYVGWTFSTHLKKLGRGPLI